MFLGIIFAVVTIRGHRVREHPVVFTASLVVPLLLALFYILPQIGTLTMPADPVAARTASEPPTTDPVVIHHSQAGFCPVRVTVTAGTTIEFVPEEGSSLRVTSDNDELELSDGNNLSTIVTKEGAFLYSDDVSTGFSWEKLISQLLGRTQSHQGVITVQASTE